MLLTLMSVWKKVAPQEKKVKKKSSNLQLKLRDPNPASFFISSLWVKVTGRTWACHDYWWLMTHVLTQRTQWSWIIIMTTQIPMSSAHWASSFLWYLSCQSLQPTHEWFIERKMSPHVVTRLICLTGTTVFHWIKRGSCELGAKLEDTQRELHICLSQLSVTGKR